MEEFEFAYYLDSRQLLLLLSLIDERPVAGLPPIEMSEDWQSVSLSLVADGRLRCEQQTLVMDERLSALLRTMKDAETVIAVHGKRPPTSQVLYLGAQPTLLEWLPEGLCRLHQTEPGEFQETVETLLMSDNPMPEELLTLLAEDETLSACIAHWEMMGELDAPDPWLAREETLGVLEYQTPTLQSRWIWIQDAAADLVLRQDADGLHAALDTAAQRRTLLQKLGLEGES